MLASADLEGPLKKLALYALFTAMFCSTIACTTAAAAGSFSLKCWEGYRFSDGKVLESKDKTADIVFADHMSFSGVAYLSAKKIKVFGKTRPNVTGITAREVETWKENENGPAPGDYYIIRTAKGAYYLLQVLDFENQLKVPQEWRIKLKAEPIQIR